MNNKYKCIKHKCKYYFKSDIYIKCLIANRYIKNGNCIGITPAKKIAEEETCRISKLINKINEIKGLEKYVKENQ